jgi:hypothetical protein
MARLFPLAVFAGAFLSFSLEPMVGRMILPRFGGAPAVWTTAMLFFQAMLLAGYAYAHLATAWLGTRRTTVLHLVVVLLALLSLPVVVPADWTPTAEGSPVPCLLGYLLRYVGSPFLVICAGTPLLQKWFAATSQAESRDPYVLYAASNSGSLAGLLSYPILIEPNLGLRQQAWFWALGYGVVVVLLGSCALTVWRYPRSAPLGSSADDGTGTDNAVIKIDFLTRLRWIILAFVPSSLLLGVTTHISTDLAPVPLLWVIPLSLYLLTLAVAFAKPPGGFHRCLVWSLPVFIILPLAIPALPGAWRTALPLHIALNLASFTAIAFVFHGELAARKPAAAASTEFQLWMALGGVLGGVFNAVLAPLMFSTLLEYELVLVLAGLTMPRWKSCWPALAGRVREFATVGLVGMLTAGLWWQASAPYWRYGVPLLTCSLLLTRPFLFGLGTGIILLTAHTDAVPKGSQESYRARSFYGTLSVVEDLGGHSRGLYHGRTLHGIQCFDGPARRLPLMYYDITSPIGMVFNALRADGSGSRRSLGSVAITGLGTGTLAAYGWTGEEFTFFEIDPEVERVARTQFTYLRDSRASCRVVVGDARLSLMREPGQKYRLIVLDAFNSDAIPTHLLTCEAVALYQDKLTPDGIIAIHITNSYLNLEPVVFAVARANGLVAQSCFDDMGTPAAIKRRKEATHWVVLARRREDFKALAYDPRWRLVCRQDVRAWTDDYSNLVGVLDPARWTGSSNVGRDPASPSMLARFFSAR